MSKQLVQFLRDLQANNNRPWFQENKDRYETVRKEFVANVQELIDKIAVFDPAVAGLEAKDCMYRIYRDIRFSPNKLPYKNHMGAYLSKGGRKSVYSGYYIHIEPGNCILSGGLWRPDPPILKALRKDIYENMDEFIEILENPEFKKYYPGLDGEQLKRMPAGFPIDTPHGEVLLFKDYCITASVPDDFFYRKNWIEEAVEIFKKQLPFHRFLNFTVDEYFGGER